MLLPLSSGLFMETPMPRFAGPLFLSLLALGACSNEVETKIDQNLLNQVKTLEDCLPDLFGHANAVVELAKTWQLTDDTNTDPAGVSSQINGNELLATFNYSDGAGISGTVSMTIKFWQNNGPQFNGTQFSPTFSGSSLSERIDAAATQLGQQFPGQDPYITGNWTLTGFTDQMAVTGSGILGGIIGGAANQNELESVSTLANETSITTFAVNTVSSSGCELEFSTQSLVTDEDVGQEYPRGTIDLSLTKAATGNQDQITVATDLVFDKTRFATGTITLNGTDVGSFTLDLETLDVRVTN
jgi:hypothetical protein